MALRPQEVKETEQNKSRLRMTEREGGGTPAGLAAARVINLRCKLEQIERGEVHKNRG